MSIERQSFGRTPDGTDVDQYILRSDTGVIVRIITYGGRITELHALDRDGRPGNITLGYDRLEPYLLPGDPYFGALIGRVANRIAGGKFTLDGKEYRLPVNNGPNTLHGGARGFDRAVWKASQADSADSPALRLSHTSPDGDQGFPGTLEVTVIYTLAADALRIEYSATTDRPTPVNLTNHAYFNLRGAGSGDVLGHELMLAAGRYTPVNAELIPTGQIAPVRGTPFDFTTATPIGKRIEQTPGGYDLNFCLDTAGNLGGLAARVHEPATGRALEVYTTQPGVQFYTGNFLNGSQRGIGGAYQKHSAFCLETQHYPDAVHHDNFPSIILRPGQTYRHTTIYRLAADRA